MPQARGIAISDLSYPRGAGQSHETILFNAQWREGAQEIARGLGRCCATTPRATGGE
jgi:hypothetical protein